MSSYDPQVSFAVSLFLIVMFFIFILELSLSRMKMADHNQLYLNEFGKKTLQ